MGEEGGGSWQPVRGGDGVLGAAIWLLPSRKQETRGKGECESLQEESCGGVEREEKGRAGGERNEREGGVRGEYG